MSDGTSDSRPYDIKHEKWTEVGDVKLKKPIDVSFYHYRDGLVASCILLEIEFSVSRWGHFHVDEGVAFVPRDTESMAREAMAKAVLKALNKDHYKKKYVKETDD